MVEIVEEALVILFKYGIIQIEEVRFE